MLLRGFGDYVMKPVGAHIPRAAGDFWREGSSFYRVLIRARLTRVLTSCFRINLKCQGLLSEYKQVQLQKEFLPCFCSFPDGYWKPNFHLKLIMPQSLEEYREERWKPDWISWRGMGEEGEDYLLPNNCLLVLTLAFLNEGRRKKRSSRIGAGRCWCGTSTVVFGGVWRNLKETQEVGVSIYTWICKMSYVRKARRGKNPGCTWVDLITT